MGFKDIIPSFIPGLDMGKVSLIPLLLLTYRLLTLPRYHIAIFRSIEQF